MPEAPAAGGAGPLLALGIDYGERRIGVAAGDTLTRSARPLGVVAARAGTPDWPALERYVRDWQPRILVVGLPCNMDGTPTRLTEAVRGFAAELARRCSLEVVLVDERLTSREAEDRLRQRRASGERARRVRAADVDPVAACVLLEQWLHTRPDPSPASE